MKRDDDLSMQLARFSEGQSETQVRRRQEGKGPQGNCSHPAPARPLGPSAEQLTVLPH